MTSKSQTTATYVGYRPAEDIARDLMKSPVNRDPDLLWRLVCQKDEVNDALRHEIDRLRVAAVRAVMPLEVLRMSGWQTKFTPEVQQAIDEGIAAVRDAIS